MLYDPKRSKMNEVLRDSPFGQIVRFLSKNKYFQYAEERDGFQNPYYGSNTSEKEVEKEVDIELPTTAGSSNTTLDETTSAGLERPSSRDPTTKAPLPDADNDVENGQSDNPIERVITMQSHSEVQRIESRPIKPTTTSDGTILVDWYTTGNTLWSYQHL
jgi:DHA1 family multidrug resistance protein-like MFS transporter